MTSSLLKTIEETQALVENVPEEKRQALLGSLTTLAKKLMDRIVPFADIPQDFENNILPAMTAQLQAAEKRTEKAADDIMSATEAIMGALGQVEGSGKDAIQNSVNALFEACNFQDLVAQHLSEIKLLLDDLQADMTALNESINESAEDSGSAAPAKRERTPKRSDSHLLNGPATDV